MIMMVGNRIYWISSSIVHNRVSLLFLYICANPFIYATKFDPVRRILKGLIPDL